jgi:hypothetical protein
MQDERLILPEDAFSEFQRGLVAVRAAGLR